MKATTHFLLKQLIDELGRALAVHIIVHTDRAVVSILVLSFLDEDLVLHLVQFDFLGVRWHPGVLLVQEGCLLRAARTVAPFALLVVAINVVTELLKAVRKILAELVLHFGLGHGQYTRIDLVLAICLIFIDLLQLSLSHFHELHLHEGVHPHVALGNLQVVRHLQLVGLGVKAELYGRQKELRQGGNVGVTHYMQHISLLILWIICLRSIQIAFNILESISEFAHKGMAILLLSQMLLLDLVL